MRAFRVFPIIRTDQDFAVLPAFFAMKFVYRHEEILFPEMKTSSREQRPIRLKGLTSLTLLIISHLRLNTILNKTVRRLYTVNYQ